MANGTWSELETGSRVSTTMTFPPRPIVSSIVSQHLEDAASLRSVRSVLVRAPHARLLQLARTDERLLAHLDGLSVAGDEGFRLSKASLEVPGVGQLFVNAVLSVERRDGMQLDRLLSLVDVVPDASRALASAFGWVEPSSLVGLTAPLLGAAQPLHRWLGLAACAAHGVDPGGALAAAIEQAHAGLRWRAFRAAGQLGRQDLLPACLAQLDDEAPRCRLAAAWSAVLLGDQGAGAQALRSMALEPRGQEALQLALLTADPDAARHLVQQLVAHDAPLRTTIRATGWAGDLQVVPWLIDHMADDAQARIAGEAFSLLTGADLAMLDLERKPPDTVACGPSESADDDDVALDEDESLPWPDKARVQTWWESKRNSMPSTGRCFVGAAPGEAHLLRVLREAPQRQRRAAALMLCAADPGQPLFNVAAPSPRQKRLLQLPA